MIDIKMSRRPCRSRLSSRESTAPSSALRPGDGSRLCESSACSSDCSFRRRTGAYSPPKNSEKGGASCPWSIVPNRRAPLPSQQPVIRPKQILHISFPRGLPYESAGISSIILSDSRFFLLFFRFPFVFLLKPVIQRQNGFIRRVPEPKTILLIIEPPGGAAACALGQRHAVPTFGGVRGQGGVRYFVS